MTEILDLVIENSDAGDGITIRDYLRTLLATLWREGETFSGKRPLGNSGWDYELYPPLIEAGLVKGTMSEDGISEIDEAAAHKLIAQAIDDL